MGRRHETVATETRNDENCANGRTEPPGGAMARAVRFLLAAGLALSVSGAAAAADPPASFPNRPIRVIRALPRRRSKRHRGAPDRPDHEPRLGTAGGDRK